MLIPHKMTCINFLAGALLLGLLTQSAYGQVLPDNFFEIGAEVGYSRNQTSTPGTSKSSSAGLRMGTVYPSRRLGVAARVIALEDRHESGKSGSGSLQVEYYPKAINGNGNALYLFAGESVTHSRGVAGSDSVPGRFLWGAMAGIGLRYAIVKMSVRVELVGSTESGVLSNTTPSASVPGRKTLGVRAGLLYQLF